MAVDLSTLVPVDDPSTPPVATAAPATPPPNLDDLVPVEPAGAIRRVLGDTGVSLAKGAVDVGQGLYGVADAATGGELDRAAQTVTGNRISTGFNAVQDALSEGYSNEAPAAQKKFNDATGVVDSAKAAIQNPSVIANAFAESVPNLLGAAGAIRSVAMKAGETALKAAIEAGATQAEAKAAQAAAVTKWSTGAPGVGVQAGVNAAQAGGASGEDAKNAVLNIDQKVLDTSPLYQQMIEKGLSPADARAQVADMAQTHAFLISGGVAGASTPIGAGVEGRAATIGLVRKATSGFLGIPEEAVANAAGKTSGFFKTLGVEAGSQAAQGAIQGAGSAYAGNEAASLANPNQDLTAGVAKGAVTGAVQGGLMGAVMSGLHQSAGHPEVANEPANPAATPPVEPPATPPADGAVPESLRLQALAAHGPISSAAADAIAGGAHADQLAKANEQINAGTEPLLLPAPAGHAEQVQSEKLNDYASAMPAAPLEQAQTAALHASANGLDYSVVPHPAGDGYTVVPTSLVPPKAVEQFAGLQRPGGAALPSPDATRPGSFIAPERGAPVAATYDEAGDGIGLRNALAEDRATNDQPTPRGASALDRGPSAVAPGVPLATVEAAQKKATQLTAKSGVEHEVVPHPIAAGKFGVRPIPATIDGEATRVQDQTPFTGREQPAGVNNGSKDATQNATQESPAQAGGKEGADGAALSTNDVGRTAVDAGAGLQQDANGAGRGSVASDPEAAAKFAAAAHEAATSNENDKPFPTPAQQEAGNYAKGHVQVHGLDVSIENPAGSSRIANDGSWAKTQDNHYGYIRKTQGADGDHVDTFVGPNPESKRVFVVDQVKPEDGSFDEHKVMLGFDTPEAAQAAYKAAYPADWKGFGGMTETGPERLKTWLRVGDTTKPFGKTEEPASSKQAADMEPRDKTLSDADMVEHAISDDTTKRVDYTTDPQVKRLVQTQYKFPNHLQAFAAKAKSLTAEEANTVATAIAKLRANGHPDERLADLHSIFSQDKGSEGTYYPDAQSIGLDREMLARAKTEPRWAQKLAGVIAHELSHRADEGEFAYHSGESAAFKISEQSGKNGTRTPTGPIAKEAYAAFVKYPELRKYLAYPFRLMHDDPSNGHTDAQHVEMLQAETFAQLNALYYTNPKLLERTMPKAFGLFKDIHERTTVGGGEGRGTESPVQQGLRAIDSNGGPAERVAGRDQSPDRARPSNKDARAGVEQAADVRQRSDEAGASGRGSGVGEPGVSAAPASRSLAREASRLKGLPESSVGPSAEAQAAGRRYMAGTGREYTPPTEHVTVDADRAQRIAQAYEAMPHAPEDPKVKAAYKAMIKETLDQWQAIKKTGLKVDFADKDHPYPYKVPSDMLRDVKENNHMWVFPTDQGFGSDAAHDVSGNPLLAKTGEVINGHHLLANDVFRIVHDYFGHVKDGVGFRASGEENAWRSHAAMYSDLARQAMTTETRGQNSWVNFGPHGEANRTAKEGETHYAPQKTGLLPEEFSKDTYERSGKRPMDVKAGDDTLSTRNPTAKKATEDPLKQKLLSGLDASKMDEDAFRKNVNLLASYDDHPKGGRPLKTEARFENIVSHMVDNLMFLHDNMSKEDRERAQLWYDGAHKIANEWGEEFGKPRRAMAAVMATLSPQTPWHENVSAARRVVEALRDQQNTPWSDKMQKVSDRIWDADNKKHAKIVAEITGKKLGELTDEFQKAAWIRTFDEAHNDRSHRLVTPEGGYGDVERNKSGSVTQTRWRSLDSIAKAVSVYENPTLANIHEQLGNEHKVRNFYNNIVSPNSPDGHTTIDTHAVAAAHMLPLGGTAQEVTANFGGKGSASSSINGSSGTYGLYQEAYKRAAAKAGILPRQMQSITWESVRSLFDSGSKAHIVDKARAIWKEYANGKITADEARKRIVELAGGFKRPDWISADKLDAEKRDTADAGKLSGDGVPGRDTEAVDGGGRGDATGDVSKGRKQPLDAVVGDESVNRKQDLDLRTSVPDDKGFYRWFGDSKAVDNNGEPKLLYHITKNDFDSFEPGGPDDRVSGPAIWLGEDPSKLPAAHNVGGYNGNFKEGARTIPVYARMENPLHVNDENRQALTDRFAGSGFPNRMEAAWVEKLQKAGYDSIIYDGRNTKEHIVFSGDQVKQAISNDGNYGRGRKQDLNAVVGDEKKPYTLNPAPEDRVKNAEALFTKAGKLLTPKAAVEKPAWVDNADSATQSFLRKSGVYVPKTTWRERWDGIKHELGLKIIQATLDQYRPVLEKVSKYSYQLLRMASASDNGLSALVQFGHVELNDWGALKVKSGTKSLKQIMAPLAGEHDRFLAWVAANRAEQLMSEDREHNFTAEEIAAGKKLNTVMNATDTFKGEGTREAAYEQAKKDFAAMNKSVLDVAEKAGIIDPEARKLFESDYYVNFRREEDGEPEFNPSNVSGMVNAKGIKRLQGGDAVLHDLMANTMSNWSSLLSSAMKNNAAWHTLEESEGLGLAHRVKASEAGKGDIYVLQDGKEVHWHIDDPLVSQALSSMTAAPMKGPIMKGLGVMKHALTVGTTWSPIFRIRHTIREQITALAANDTGYNPVKNWLDGFKYSSKDNPEYGNMSAGGAFFNLGLDFEGDRAAYVKRLIDHEIDPKSLVDSPNKAAAMFGHAADWWKEVGERSDSITRANLYRQAYAKAIADGHDPERAHFEASYVARDAMDYSLHGTLPALRMITQVVPFMNARLQGLYKLGRGAHEDPKRFAAVVGGITLATIALSLAQRKDKDIQAASDWDKNNNWLVKVGNTMYRIPKPFEVGAIATVADRTLTLALDGFHPADRERFAQQVREIAVSQLNLNPIPQAVFPALQIWANKNEFTGAPIEPQRDEKLSPGMHEGPSTSAVAHELGKLGILSPQQIDFAVSAYFGWVGAHAVATADLALRPLTDLPSKPTPKLDDYFLVGDFAHSLPSAQSQFMTDYYQNLHTVQQAFGDMRELQKTGQTAKAIELMKDKKDTIALNAEYTRVMRQIGKLNLQERYVNMTTSLSPEDKRAKLDSINQHKNALAEMAEKARDAQLDR